MVFWVIMAVLAVSATVSVLVPLNRNRRIDQRTAEPEVSVYRDQLDEIARDRDRGVIGEAEAEAARTEIARRLIKAGAAGSEVGNSSSAASRSRQVAGVLAVVGIPVLAIGFYLFVGSPNLPDAPLEARLNAAPGEQDIATLISRVEAHLAQNPDDSEGWELIAPVYIRLGRLDDAEEAHRNILRLLGSTAERESALGEVIVQANGGQVTTAAREAFEKAIALDPSLVGPRFYLALAEGQAGRTAEAAVALRALISEAPPGAPWLGVVRGALAQLAPDDGDLAGPTTEDIEAAGDLAPDDRLAMIEDMVDGLAARLQAEPDYAEGWARLVRSYMVLERPDDARTALAEARAALAGDRASTAVVEAEAKALGIAD
ncbi:MAG: c-type cytochrome biogenesis protein CcmI [Hyphomicrobiales bacterium]|nr:c-type cytochrome biogenesis protein CcmI [Hyphomicrobiales bacterium]